MQSEQINELAEALCQAQAKLESAKKDANNPFFKSKYATLESSWEACRDVLTSNGISVVQQPLKTSQNGTVCVRTTLLHKSGQWIYGEIELPVSKPDAQGYGSAISYARRYGLQALVGICAEDDDGNGAANLGNDRVKITKAQKPDPKARLMNQLSSFMKANNITKEEIQDWCLDLNGTKDSSKLTEKQLKELLDYAAIKTEIVNHAPKV